MCFGCWFGKHLNHVSRAKLGHIHNYMSSSKNILHPEKYLVRWAKVLVDFGLGVQSLEVQIARLDYRWGRSLLTKSPSYLKAPILILNFFYARWSPGGLIYIEVIMCLLAPCMFNLNWKLGKNSVFYVLTCSL